MLKLNFKSKLFLALLLGFLFIMPVNAADYTIKDYDITVNVNENNSYDIEEKITVNFPGQNHGIYRTIPIRGEVKRFDTNGEEVTADSIKNVKVDSYKAKVKNIKVNENFETSYVGDDIMIKIGDPDRLVTGDQTYTIKYTFYLGRDLLDGADEFYYNLIGTDWATTIDNVTFKITLPKEFDSSKLGFSKGLSGTANSAGVEFSVDGNTIIGTANNFSPHEALTVRTTLEDGYFVYKRNIALFAIYLIPLALVGYCYVLWKKYGVDDIVVDQVEFYPPNDLNSLDIAFCYNGNVNSKDVVSLIIYLANKGYLSVSESTSGKIIKKDTFTLTKLKEYDGTNEEERIFFNGLFKGGRTTVTKDDLQYTFYETMNRVLSNKNRKKNYDTIFESNASSKQLLTGFLFVLGLILVVLKPFIGNFYVGWFGTAAAAFIISLIGFVVPYVVFTKNKGSFILKFLSIVIGVIFIAAGTIFCLGEILTEDYLDLAGYIFGMLSLAGVLFFVGIMQKRTEYGTNILGKINGFKSFLETAEKEKLTALVEENPSYFFNILPYTYVLGVSNKWIKKFEDINMQPPEWYSSSSPYDYYRFTHFMDDTVNTANQAMVSTPAPEGGGSSSFGGFTGGGFSGGGFGGGGGGSW